MIRFLFFRWFMGPPNIMVVGMGEVVVTVNLGCQLDWI